MTESKYKHILVERDNAVATVTLNRPDAMNALSSALLHELQSELQILKDESAIKVIILTGAGKAFSAGVDLKEFSGKEAANGSFEGFFEISGHEIHHLISDMPKVVIARINGHCYTGALEIVMACDLIVVAEEAKLGDTHTRWGLAPRWGLSQRLPRRIGMLKARELCFCARIFSGSEAKDMGLANHVAPLADIDDVITDLCDQLTANSPGAIAAYKSLFRMAEELPLSDGMEQEFDARYEIPDTGSRLEQFLSRAG